MLVEEERNSSNLRALLQVTRDRLETETRRADAAESRATIAEARTREVTSRTATAEQAQHRSELDTARAQEETKRVQMQLETAERELRRVTNELQRLTRQKEEAEDGGESAGLGAQISVCAEGPPGARGGPTRGDPTGAVEAVRRWEGRRLGRGAHRRLGCRSGGRVGRRTESGLRGGSRDGQEGRTTVRGARAAIRALEGGTKPKALRGGRRRGDSRQISVRQRSKRRSKRCVHCQIVEANTQICEQSQERTRTWVESVAR
jgi:hypothetical protein